MSIEKQLEKLLKKDADLKTQIKEAKRLKAEQEAETLRKRGEILGLALIAEMEASPQLSAQLEPLLNKRITKARDRLFMGLKPLKQPKPAPPPANQNEAPKE